MATALTILVGTMTGTADMVAEEVKDVLEERDFEVEIVAMEDAGPGILERGGLFLVCSSTYGQGDVPDNAQTFYEKLQQERPDLSNVEYGVVGLGDMTYSDTFCFGPKRFDSILAELGAKRLGEMFLHDASSGTMPEDEAMDWAAEWADNLDEARSQAA